MAVEGATPAERLAKQRRSLRKRLGMGGKLDELMETDNLIKDEDLLVADGPAAGKQGKASTEAAELLTNMEGMSSSSYGYRVSNNYHIQYIASWLTSAAPTLTRQRPC